MKTSIIRKILLERLSYCSKGAFEAAVEPNIPPKQAERIKKAFKISDETILGIIDTSLFSRGKNGLVFTDKGVYFLDVLANIKYRRYIDDWRAGEDTAFDSLGIKPDNALIDTFAVTSLIDAIVTELAKLPQEVEEPKEEEPKEEEPIEKPAPKPEGIDTHEPLKAAEETDEEDEEEDEEDDDDDDVGLLDLFGVILDVTSDPSEE